VKHDKTRKDGRGLFFFFRGLCENEQKQRDRMKHPKPNQNESKRMDDLFVFIESEESLRSSVNQKPKKKKKEKLVGPLGLATPNRPQYLCERFPTHEFPLWFSFTILPLDRFAA
jgi:hypothetical protein